MKKSLLALAVLGAFAGVASAQSSVTLYGTVDLNARYVKNTDQKRSVSLSQNGINSSQLGFKGTEDIGGGLKAGFVLVGGVNPDTGTTNAKFFNRRSTVSLMGNFGEIRLGRDYVPTFWNNTEFDAFGTNGIGASDNVRQTTVFPNFARADNSVGYFLPSNIGGVYGQFMAAAGEGSASGRYLGARVGFAAGPVDVAVAYGQQKLSPVQSKEYNVGGSYNFGVVKLMGYFDQTKQDTNKENRFSIGAVVPVGQAEIRAGFEQSKLTDTGYSNKVNQFSLGGQYNITKRTAVYTTVSRLKNGNGSALSLPSGFAAPTAGGKSQGFDVGVRHFF
jgi:predicted porin